MMSKDDQIIYFANEFHLVTRAHLAQLTGRNPKSLNESLRRLVQQQRLYCKAQSIYKPYVYATYDIRKRQHFDHDLGITAVHLALYKTGKLIEWRQHNEKRKGEVNEDATFWLSVALPKRIGRIKYYLEYDTGTEPIWQINDKVTRYISLRQSTTVPFHVLFICQQEARIKQLAALMQSFLDKDKPTGWKFILFAYIEETLTNTTGEICNIAYAQAKCPIFPNLNS